MSNRIGKILTAGLVVAGLSASAGVAEAKNDRFMEVLKRGEVRIGVKATYKPWGFRDPSGTLVGMEADMAQEVADTLGVKLTLVAVESANRMQFLQRGKIDLMIATMTDKSDRRKVVGVVDPNYYTSGTNVLARKSTNLKKWTDLKGKPVCGRQGSFQNKPTTVKYGAKIIAFTGHAEAKQALFDKRCVAFLSDDSVIQNELQNEELAKDFEMPLPTHWATPWGLAVPLEERDRIWGKFMSGMVYQWLASGRLLELEKKWGIQQSAYLVKQSERFAYDHTHLK